MHGGGKHRSRPYHLVMSSRPPMRAVLWRWRRLITAALLALCLALVVSAIGSSGRVLPTELLVAASDLPAGHRLTEDDVRKIPAPAGVVPEDQAIDMASGQRLSISLPEGTPITQSMLIGPTLVDGLPEGTVIVPVYLSTPAELTPAGSKVDLWSSDETGTAILAATDATILAFSEVDASSGFLSTGDNLTYAYVAIDAEQATLVLGISARTPLLAVLHS